MIFTMDSEEYKLQIEKDKENENELLMTISLNENLDFFGRLKLGFKRLFGYRCRYGDFDCLSLTEKDLIKIIYRFKNGK